MVSTLNSNNGSMTTESYLLHTIKEHKTQNTEQYDRDAQCREAE